MRPLVIYSWPRRSKTMWAARSERDPEKGLEQSQSVWFQRNGDRLLGLFDRRGSYIRTTPTGARMSARTRSSTIIPHPLLLCELARCWRHPQRKCLLIATGRRYPYLHEFLFSVFLFHFLIYYRSSLFVKQNLIASKPKQTKTILFCFWINPRATNKTFRLKTILVLTKTKRKKRIRVCYCQI